MKKHNVKPSRQRLYLSVQYNYTLYLSVTQHIYDSIFTFLILEPEATVVKEEPQFCNVFIVS